MSFLKHYRDYVQGTEAHPTYHTFSALVALATIVGRRVWIPMGHFDVVPNLYVVLVGPSGNRKTSAMTPAKNLIRTLGLPFSGESVTKEKLVLDVFAQERVIAGMPPDPKFDKYRTYSPMTCMVTELSEFLGGGGIGMINFLVTIYDQDYYDIRTKNKGDTAIKGPYLCVLACTTPDWITIYLRQDVISGGFSRRAIFVHETGKANRIAFPEITPAMAQAWHDLVDYSKRLLSIYGPFTWEPEAKAFFENWYMTQRIPSDPMLAGYYESKHIQLLKIAMLIALSESTDLVMRVKYLTFGLELLALAEVNMGKVFAGMGRNELYAVSQRAIDLLERAGGALKKKKFLALMFKEADSSESMQVLEYLLKGEYVVEYERKGADSTTPSQFYIALPGVVEKARKANEADRA